jgi:hypothetical protein
MDFFSGVAWLLPAAGMIVFAGVAAWLIVGRGLGRRPRR